MIFEGRARTATWKSSRITEVSAELLPWMFVTGVVLAVSITPVAVPAAAEVEKPAPAEKDEDASK